MYARYDVISAKNDTSYQFITSSGTKYFAYFTEFILQDKNGHKVPVLSFGFSCKLADNQERQRYDVKIKNTIIFIVNEFFRNQPTDAVLYLCMTHDDKGRNRHITFNRWFNEVANDLDKYNTPKESAKHGFYGSILVKSANPDKQRFIDAFYFTIDFWG